MTKEKILETAFAQIESTIGDDFYEYAENQTMVLATLAEVWGIVRDTERFLEMVENED